MGRPDDRSLADEATAYRANFRLSTLAGYYAFRARTFEIPRRISLLVANDGTRDPRSAARCHRRLLSGVARGSVRGFSQARKQSRRPDPVAGAADRPAGANRRARDRLGRLEPTGR